MLGIFSIFLESAEKGPNLHSGLTQRKVDGQQKREFLFREHLRKFKLLLENLKLSR